MLDAGIARRHDDDTEGAAHVAPLFNVLLLLPRAEVGDDLARVGRFLADAAHSEVFAAAVGLEGETPSGAVQAHEREKAIGLDRERDGFVEDLAQVREVVGLYVRVEAPRPLQIACLGRHQVEKLRLVYETVTAMGRYRVVQFDHELRGLDIVRKQGITPLRRDVEVDAGACKRAQTFCGHAERARAGIEEVGEERFLDTIGTPQQLVLDELLQVAHHLLPAAAVERRDLVGREDVEARDVGGDGKMSPIEAQ